MLKKGKIKNILKEDDLYPEITNQDFSSKIYKKREFYFHKIPQRKKLENYEDIEKYRNDACSKDFNPKEQQAIMSNFLSPFTPYNGILVMHGTGVGKTATSILIAEQYKDQVKKYNTKIYVLTSGPNIRENFKNELLFATGETYLKNKDILEQMSSNEVERERKIAIYSSLQYYKIMSYKTFHRKVLGEKIVEKKLTADNKIKSTYKKNLEGEIEREIVIDRITSLNNSIIIVDEAHNLTGNEWGMSLKKIAANSENLKIILLTATPMKNLADDIISLINFLRPPDDPILRDKVFTNEKNYLMKLKLGGEEYLRDKVNGYISYFRGSIPYTFADRVDMGKVPNELLFTPVIRCKMHDFQLETYSKAAKDFDDALDRAASSAANFVVPILNKDKTKIIGTYSSDGISKLLSQVNADRNVLLNLINKDLFKNKIPKNELNEFIVETPRKTFGGNILKLEYLKTFSSKFYQAIVNINELIESKRGAGTCFVYSNLVKAGGIELFAEALNSNGYFEYNEDMDYDLKDNSRDSKTGLTLSEFKKKNKPLSEFNPSTYILVTGGLEEGDDIPEVKQRIIRNVFNSVENRHGKILKLVLGSKVMNEGVTLENAKDVHILDVHYNLAKVEQVIGRAIRFCKHMAVTNKENPFPTVNVYRYVVTLKKGLSSDEVLYQKAEKKYILVKKIERILKETAIDCPLLLHGNMFPEEFEKHKGCVAPTIENKKKGKKICPALCDFKECDIKCYGNKLNKKYYDEKNRTYVDIPPEKLDYSTFNESLAKYEINHVKDMIKDLYKFKSVYIYDEIIRKIKKSLKKKQANLFDNFFLDKALEEMMPVSENEFNNFIDILRDKYNRPGYLRQFNEYYVFQPFNENENVPMYYRNNIDIEMNNLITVDNYLNKNFGEDKSKKERKIKFKSYDFDSVLEYYSKRDENFIVGIIDMNTNKLAYSDDDLFKIREPREKNLDKKRGTGIPTFKGAVCSTSKSKGYLLKILEKLEKISSKYNFPSKLKKAKGEVRTNICNIIRDNLLILEKYSKTKDKNKITYIMVPNKHPIYPFPYNLEDRVKYIVNELELKDKDYLVKKSTKNNIDMYTIEFKKKINDQCLEFLNRLGKLNNKKLVLD
tara:strand:- start:6243 stop:9590 length:3348 start_codon:yes stop_codon:yes gene_type:complete